MRYFTWFKGIDFKTTVEPFEFELNPTKGDQICRGDGKVFEIKRIMHVENASARVFAEELQC